MGVESAIMFCQKMSSRFSSEESDDIDPLSESELSSERVPFI